MYLCLLFSGQHRAFDSTKAYWHEAEILTHSTANDVAKQSRLPASDQQFRQVSSVTGSSTQPIMAASSGTGSITTQQTSTAETSPVVTQVLSTGQKKRVDVLFMS